MNQPASSSSMVSISRAFSFFMVCAVFLYLINNYLVYWQGFPGSWFMLAHLGWLGIEQDKPLTQAQLMQGWGQIAGYGALLAGAVWYALRRKAVPLQQDAVRLHHIASYIIRAAFWTVFLVGSVDMIISLLRVENFLPQLIGENLTSELGRPAFRGQYVHYPLVFISLVLAGLFRSISFSWLALMVVLSEFSIVITRFVFSYEQAYMGDLVRFWYAALFLFASSYTLVQEGHVRVDVLYAGMKKKSKARVNIVGTLLLGMPLCWVILMQGMGGRGNSINSPFLSFEISQSGYGMYVKYLMAGYLVIFAVSMLIQFCSYLLHNVAILNESDPDDLEEYNVICCSTETAHHAHMQTEVK
jgi:TRAP-type mannitol/chloroaromatic compound transport system permease small subunit